MRKKLEEYAELALKIGVNIQEGQKLFINTPIHAVEFTRIIAKKAYEMGVKDVIYSWNDDILSYTRFKNVSMETLEDFPEWTIKQMEDLAEEGAAFLHIISPDPELLKDVDPKKVAAAAKSNSIALKKYREKVMSDENAWCVLAVPSENWAKKVYPDLNKDEAVDKLWKSIFSVARVEEGKSVEDWKNHDINLKNKVEILNLKKFKTLHYKSKGTDLYVEMSPKQIWKAGASITKGGVEFSPNIPTEEVFSMPKKDGVNGVLSSTMPLNYGGNLIDNFKLTFKDGKIVEFTAETGYEILKNLLETDEGAKYLGEIALVPVDSPISNTNTIFYNTLFDENASCHFAFGTAYRSCIEGGTEMTLEELEKNGVNDSLVHVDFMVGSEDLSIDGIDENGALTPIFRNGNWAI
ncbi:MULTISPECIES: aminopeptidase [Psychrilyobacter]|uniref:Aminopeptidase n=1 Tax=Psychrilyobacter piezotolerans TaxID=2293438 RepID=A0ABX9KH77_9FUSO|nr:MULTISPECIES: aminopeptidase [Psychrilyobacter]MCS5422544.1 aminopeptidase [Psychrilyobacter sp. S5]NDI77971.1 aminopeptidase [Psychrilyobacter piezotolerans]RDE62085.1 aminopeptidase [Psychrilyobacter sp. S5]REI41332.1 aminopeptidase [Psychrilyobacter piezotolerans]